MQKQPINAKQSVTNGLADQPANHYNDQYSGSKSCVHTTNKGNVFMAKIKT